MMAAFALAIPACGGDGGDGRPGTLADSPGANVFADAGCGDCHTMQAAGASGKVGPNLDEAQPDADQVERQVRDGGGGMPSFDDKLSDREITDVSQFVAAGTRATGGE